MTITTNKTSLEQIKKFFEKNDWKPIPFQIESWQAYLNGENGIIQVPTGCGKTYAALMGPLSKLNDCKKSGLNILLDSLLDNIRERDSGVVIRIFGGLSICFFFS